ncbi:MAG TPA: MFS transporter [Flavisolibacter sp.]|jgi:predicted MFS family arabinose efflux permease|nr:MFS transporter [Flavisolibacter sp.]
MDTQQPTSFTSYQKGVIALLAIIQFTIILDFMVMSPLGDVLMKSMDLKATQFASAVSAYAFSAGVSGLLAAGFADKYDRKKLLLIFYTGFTLGTLLCATATSYHLLLFGRIITGLFGGVLGAVAMAIIADLFSFQQRGRVMGFVQMSFAVSQVAGIPVGLYLANVFNWHAPFLLIVGLSIVTAGFTFYYLKPVTKHIAQRAHQNPLVHLRKTVTNRFYWLPFITTALLSIGGFMLMPFSTPFIINNVGISQKQLPMIYVIMGICSMITLPLIGKLSDRIGKLATFLGGTALAMIMVVIYTNLTPVPLWQVITISAFMFAGVMSRMIPSQALMTAVPQPEDRGSFMSINSSLQQIAGGVASVIAGLVIVQLPSGQLRHFDTLGYICIAVMVVCGFCMYFINKRVSQKLSREKEARVETALPVLEG